MSATQTVQLPTGRWYEFVEQTGVEKVWLIWSAEPLPDLDAILSDVVSNKGVIANAAHIAQVQSYFKQYEPRSLEVVNDKSAKRTSVKGFGKVIVSLIELCISWTY